MSMVKNVQPINSNITKNSTYNQHIINTFIIKPFRKFRKGKNLENQFFATNCVETETPKRTWDM